MFHVNAWGIPYSAPLVGAKLVFPGPGLDGASLYEAARDRSASISSSGVPTVWLNLINYMKQNNLKLSTLKVTTIGGAAVPGGDRSRTLRDDFGVRVMHGWGMTEMSPVGTVECPKAKHRRAVRRPKRSQLSLKQGRPLYGVDMKIVDGDGNELPRDGKAFGNLLVQGSVGRARILQERRRRARSRRTAGFRPETSATIDADGYLQITDRSKDVIKSGGEWISSIDLGEHRRRPSRP